MSPRGEEGDPGPAGVSPGWVLWLHAVRPVPELVTLARLAEEFGAAGLLLADEGTDRDIYVTLAAVAAATESVALVPAITNPHSRHPVVTAAALASLEELAPGRVVAGLGAGGNLVFDPMGIRPARPFSALREAVNVIDRLLAGERVDHNGEFVTAGAAIPWSSRRLPIAIAGRGTRVERFAAERADWVILAGRVADEVPQLVARLRGSGGAEGTGGRRPLVVWNPAAAWRSEHANEVRAHFAYMAIDMPVVEREALGITDQQVAVLREEVHGQGPEAAAALVPDQLVRRYATIGARAEVVARLAERCRAASPDFVAFSAYEYSSDYIREIAEVASEVGLQATPGRRARLDSQIGAGASERPVS